MQDAFDHHEIAALVRVVDKACAELDGCNEATRIMIAERVLAYASLGQTDPETLLSSVLYGQGEVRHAA